MTTSKKPKIIRACTVSMSLDFVTGMLDDLSEKYDVVMLSSPGPEMDRLEKAGKARCIAVPMERHISPVKDFVSLCRLIRVFHNEKPAMVHSMTPKAGLLCMMAGWLTRVPIRIHTFTGLVFPTATGIKKRILMLTDGITCWCATHVIPEGEGVKQDLLSNGITSKPLKVLGYGNVRGIDMQRFDASRLYRNKPLTNTNTATGCTDNKDKQPTLPHREEAEREQPFSFLFVGRIVRDKGINELVEAFVRLNEEIPETTLVLVGFFEENLDPVSEETKRLIEQHPAISYVGEKTGDDLILQYATANCFVFPSYREGFPNTVLEAGAMGLPCIVTDINGSREIIRDKKNGIIIPTKDSDALYEAMKAMASDTKMHDEMAKNARPMIESRFEQGFVRQCLYDFYEEVMK